MGLSACFLPAFRLDGAVKQKARRRIIFIFELESIKICCYNVFNSYTIFTACLPNIYNSFQGHVGMLVSLSRKSICFFVHLSVAFKNLDQGKSLRNKGSIPCRHGACSQTMCLCLFTFVCLFVIHCFLHITRIYLKLVSS